jgi:hypothetical protein
MPKIIAHVFLTSLALTSAASAAPLYRAAESGSLPDRSAALRAMDAAAGDIDGDGDVDLLVAMEMSTNRALINDGTGKFVDESAKRLPQTAYDSEEVALVDLDGDGDLDAIIACEDDKRKTLLLNDGKGVFTNASDRIAQKGVSNGVETADVDGDGDLDLAFANAWTDALLINDGKAQFSDETAARLPHDSDTSQDFTAADLDGDGDLDLVSGGENGNRLLINDGKGVFADATGRLPKTETAEITRKVGAGDVDGDGDADLLFANMVADPEAWTPNRLLINDGSGAFTDETSTRMPLATEPSNSIHAGFYDLDGDGDLDILAGTITSATEAGSAPTTALINDGKGTFTAAADALPAEANGNTLDIVAADFNGDKKNDLFLATRIGADVLLFAL